MQLIRCDHCRDPEAPASEILVNVVRRIPAASGKRGSNMAVAVPAGMELCGPCAVRYALLVRNQVEAIREGCFDLPPLPGDEAETVDLTRESAQEPAGEAPDPGVQGPLTLAAALAKHETEESPIGDPGSEQPRRTRGLRAHG